MESNAGVFGLDTLGDFRLDMSDSGLPIDEHGVSDLSSVPVELMRKLDPWMRINSPLVSPFAFSAFAQSSRPSMVFMDSEPRVPMLVVAVSFADNGLDSSSLEGDSVIEDEEILRLIFSLGDLHFSVVECNDVDLRNGFTGVVLPDPDAEENAATGVSDLDPTGGGVLIPANTPPVTDAGLGANATASVVDANLMAWMPSVLVSEVPITGNRRLCSPVAVTEVAGTMMVVGCTSLPAPAAGWTRTSPAELLAAAVLGIAARYCTVRGTTCAAAVPPRPFTADTGITCTTPFAAAAADCCCCNDQRQKTPITNCAALY